MSAPEISIDEQAAAFAAWKRGEPVEFWDDSIPPSGDWSPCLSDHSYNIGEVNSIILRKPAQPATKFRPWRPEEVPVGCLLRVKNSPLSYCTWMALNSSVSGVGYVTLSSVGNITQLELMESFEHSIDQGKTWQPCGVME